VYVVSISDDAIVVFARDESTGLLSSQQVLTFNADGLQGLLDPRMVTVSADGLNVYVVATGGDTIAVFARDADTGQLTHVQTHQDNQNGVDGLYDPYDLAVSPDGQHVYATSYADDAVSIFQRDAATGELTFLKMIQDGINGIDGLNGAWSVTISPDGGHLFVTGYDDNALAVFQRN
ncbi:MAG: lactonase family protein, partial [Planctomycetota bacterium]